MDFSVDRCRRRPDCEQLLVYFDTSTYDHLVRGNDGAKRLDGLLRRAIDEQSAICVGSPWLDDEVALLRFGPKLDRLVQSVRSYTLGLQMKFEEELIDCELSAAAREFSGQAVQIGWEEAFQDDPDEPPLQPFQAEYLNDHEGFQHPPAGVDEASYDRQISESLSQAHRELREAELNWEEVAAGNMEQQARYLLAPLDDPKSVDRASRLHGDLVNEWLGGDLEMDAGSPLAKYLRLAHVVSNAKRLRERFPKVADDPVGFLGSDAVRYLPMIRLFSFLLAALSVDGRRTKPQVGDLHDLRHLTYGLSRCDIVTADRRSCDLAQGRQLIPAGVTLCEGHTLGAIADAIEERLAAPD
jgi:hypothetical protein